VVEREAIGKRDDDVTFSAPGLEVEVVDPVEFEVDPLVAPFQSGSDEGLKALYDEHGRLVYSYCLRTLGANRAADATQEVFLGAWKSRDRYRPDAGSLAGWLLGIARFKVIDLTRVQHRNGVATGTEIVDETGTAANATPGDPERVAERLLVADALRVLPERSRKMVTMAFFDDYTHQQISEICNVPLGTVKSDIRRGLERLRRHLEGFDDSPKS